MKLNRSVLVAVTMMVGSVAGLGCKSKAAAADPTPPLDQPAAAATTDDATVAADATIAIPAPPAFREEIPAPAPSEHHVFSPGYWRYDRVQTNYVWVAGYWQDRTIVAPFAPPALHDETIEYRYAPVGDYFWAPGYWRYSGAEYVWAPGYWAPRLEGWGWVRPYWVNYGGRWECHGWGWERRGEGWSRGDRDDWSRRGWSRADRANWERRDRDGWRNRGDADRHEHEHRVNPATVAHVAPMPRPAELAHGAAAAHGSRPQHAASPTRGPAVAPRQPAGLHQGPLPTRAGHPLPQHAAAPEPARAPVATGVATGRGAVAVAHPAQAHAAAPAAPAHASAPSHVAPSSGGVHRRG